MATELRRLAGDVLLENARLRFRPASVRDGIKYMEDVPPDYWGIFEVVEVTEDGALPGIEGVRDWDELAPSTQRRYLRSKRLQNLARRAFPNVRIQRAIRLWYERGGDMRAGRGHQEEGDWRDFIARVETPRHRGLQLWIDRGRKK